MKQSPNNDQKSTIQNAAAGRVLKLGFSSNWGDPHILGLTAIEIFDGDGILISPSNFTSSICKLYNSEDTVHATTNSNSVVKHHHLSHTLSQSSMGGSIMRKTLNKAVISKDSKVLAICFKDSKLIARIIDGVNN